MESKSDLKAGFRFIAGGLVVLCLMLFPGRLTAQNVAVTDVDGYSPHTSAMLDVNSTSKGLLLPRLTTTQMNAIASPAAGLMVYNTTVGAIYIYSGTAWTNLLLFGVSSLTAPDGSPSSALVADNSGYIGINKTVPSALLHIKGTGTSPDDFIRLESSASAAYYGNIFYDTQGMKFRTRTAGSAFYFQEDAGSTNMIIQDNGWVGIGNSTPWGKLEVKGDATMNADSAIFVVKNRNGYPVFAVYDGGVRIYIDDNNGSSKGGKGGFVVGGRSTAKTAGILHDIFVLGADSARFYLEEPAKGGKGGFAVGGRTAAKGVSTRFMDITPKNYFIGHESGNYISQHPDDLTVGLYNSFMGYQSGKANTTGASNVFIGHQSGLANTTGTYNTFTGYRTGASNTIGGYNVFIGFTTGESNTEGSSNTSLGYRAGAYNQTGSNNTLVGAFAGLFYKSGTGNVMIGDNAGRQYETGDNNIFIGQSSGYGGTYAPATASGSNNVFIGKNSGYSTSTGADNVLIGTASGYKLTTGNYNAAIGFQSGYSTDVGISNSFFGYQSGYLNSSGNYNAFFGYKAGYSSGLSSYNTAMGYEAGYSLADWQGGTYVGYQAGRYNTGSQNTLIGASAGDRTTSGTKNVIVGADAGSRYDENFNSGSYNTMLGYGSGAYFGAGEKNIYLGWVAGQNSTGSRNIYIGNGAGAGTSTSENIIIGPSYSLLDQRLIIDNTNSNSTNALIYGEFDNNYLRFNANVGINVAPNNYKLYVVDGTTSSDLPAIYGVHAVTDYYGIGVYGKGGYKGVVAENTSTAGGYGVYTTVSSSGSATRYGTYSVASGPGTNYGVYSSASGGTYNYAGYFAGNVYTTGTYSSSDSRLKKNITVIPSALNKLNAIRGVYFEWETPVQTKSLSAGNGREPVMIVEEKPKGQQVGIIAQEVEAVVPEAVLTDSDGMKMVDYTKLVPLLIEAVKEQQKTIEDLQKRINLLEGNNSRGTQR